jgi:DNA-binding CsgD family transcriptional regulator
MGDAIIARDEEFASIRAFLGSVELGPAAVVLVGEPGIGKSILWEAGVREAARSFSRVISCRSVEAEASLAFAGLSDLIADVLADVGPSLRPLRRRALEVALLLAEPGEGASDPRAIGFALLDLLRVLSERGPVLVALDDVQWLDSSSAAVLLIALRRLRDERVGVLATFRRVPGVASPFELAQAFREDRLEWLWLRPLSMGALHRLLGERLALELTRAELARLQETSAGNPFFALELGRELLRMGAREAGGRALRVPESLRDLLGGRLARLQTETGDLLLHVAALARPTIDLVAAVHGDRERVLQGLETAILEGVIELDDSRLRLAHPLLASICYERAPPWKRRAVHQAIAGVVDDPDERARHLALAAEGPDAIVASSLDAAARRAAGRGAPAAAAELYRLAAKLTPDEPEHERERQFQAAKCYRLAGDGESAAVILERLLAEIPSGVGRADVLFELALTQRADSPTMIELLDEAAAEAGSDDARLARILGYRAWIRLFRADVRAALADGRAALEKAERVDNPALIAAAIGQLATAEGRAGEFTPGLLERGVEIEERLGLGLAYGESPSVSLSRRLVGLGELGRARALLESVAAKAAARGDDWLPGLVTGSLARLEWYAGNLRLALDHAAAAQELQEGMSRHGKPNAGRLRALAEADLGLVEQSRASAAEALATSEALADVEWTILTLGGLGRLELALGNVGAAVRYLRDLPRRLRASGLTDPTFPLWADTIEALLAGGELELARDYLEHYEADAERSGSPWAIAGAARCRGLLAATEGDLAAALTAFERSLAELDGLPYPLERGRTLLCQGSTHRRAKQKRAAREALAEALAIFDDLDARLWAEKARAELRRISGRRPASEELTEMEERVTLLAAEGRSNKEIASELYVSAHTVGAHLARAYRKLGVGSRRELAGRVAELEAAHSGEDGGQSGA